MSRPLSPFITAFFESRAAMDARAYNTHLAVEITLSTGAKVYNSTEPITVSTLSLAGVSTSITPVSFLGKITSAPDIQFAQTSANDGGTQFEISNLDYLLTALIPEPSRLFDGAKVVIYLCFPKTDGSYEGLPYGSGVLKSVQGDHETANLMYVSDVSDKDNTAGGRELTQRCLNTLGVNSGRSWCGATGVGSGTCTKVLDDAIGGCKYWGQEHAYQGSPFFNPVGLVANYSGNGFGNGDGGGGDTGFGNTKQYDPFYDGNLT